jgi:hypothetical protein
MYNFVDLQSFDDIDWICGGVSLGLLFFYHAFLAMHAHLRPHSSFDSHMEYQRIWWAKQIYSDTKEKITTIQNLRTFEMAISFYLKIVLTLGFAAVKLTTKVSGALPKIRGFCPALFFFISFVNLAMGALVSLYLHFYVGLEQQQAIEMAGSFRKAGRGGNEPGSPTWQSPMSPGVNWRELRRSKLQVASLVFQMKVHFKFGFRFMVLGMTFFTWSIHPVAMLCLNILLVGYLYSNDFFLPKEINALFVVEGRKPEAKEFIDRTKGVVRPTRGPAAHRHGGLDATMRSADLGSLRGTFAGPGSPGRGEGVRVPVDGDQGLWGGIGGPHPTVMFSFTEPVSHLAEPMLDRKTEPRPTAAGAAGGDQSLVGSVASNSSFTAQQQQQQPSAAIPIHRDNTMIGRGDKHSDSSDALLPHSKPPHALSIQVPHPDLETHPDHEGQGNSADGLLGGSQLANSSNASPTRVRFHAHSNQGADPVVTSDSDTEDETPVEAY